MWHKECKLTKALTKVIVLFSSALICFFFSDVHFHSQWRRISLSYRKVILLVYVNKKIIFKQRTTRPANLFWQHIEGAKHWKINL